MNAMDVILNELTETVHKYEAGSSELHAACGVTHHLAPDRLRGPRKLRRISLERASIDYDASKCGRCFDDGGGY